MKDHFTSKVVINPSKVVLHHRFSSIKGVLYRRLSSIISHQSIKRCFPEKVVLYQKLPTIKALLPSNVVFNLRMSLIKGHPSSKVVPHQRCSLYRRLSSIKGGPPSKVVPHQRSAFIKDRLPSWVVFHQGGFFHQG